MKLLLLITTLAICIIISCNQSKNSEQVIAAIKFDQDTIFFPQIPIGDSITNTYKFTNIGNTDVKIINVGSSCECTIGKFDSIMSIKPNQAGKIDVKYKNSVDKGNIIRVLIVEANTQKKLHPLYLISRKMDENL